MPSSVIGQKQDYRPPFSKLGIDLDEIWHRSFVARNTLVVQFDPDQCIGSFGPHQKDFVFVIPKMYHTS